MTWSLLFFTTNIFLGIGLAMDAFSVSMANGLNEPHMNKGRVCTIAGVFGGFQALMPLIGWFCIHTIAEYFQVFEKLSVGFTIAEYNWIMALAASLIIAIVTFFICIGGLIIGKKFGTKLSNKAQILGGIILITIGIEIFIS